MAPRRKSKRSKRSKSRSRPRTRKGRRKMTRKQSRRKRIRSKSMKGGRDYDHVIYNNQKYYYYKSKSGKPKYVEINQMDVPKLLQSMNNYTEITNSETNNNSIISEVSNKLTKFI